MNILAALVGTCAWLLLYIVWAQYTPWGSAWLHLGGYSCIAWFAAAALAAGVGTRADIKHGD